MGEILLENSQGYFLKRNKSFVFISKDGKRCIFSKHLSKKDDKYSKVDDIQFIDIDKLLTKFCSS